VSEQIKPCAICGEYPYFDDLAPFAVKCKNNKCTNGIDYVARSHSLDDLVSKWNALQHNEFFIVIPHELPALNEILGATNSNRYVGAALKKKSMQLVALYLPNKTLPTPLTADFLFYSKNARKDPDNIASGATKIIFDAMQQKGILVNDGQKQIRQLHYRFAVDKNNPRIEITLKRAM